MASEEELAGLLQQICAAMSSNYFGPTPHVDISQAPQSAIRLHIDTITCPASDRERAK